MALSWLLSSALQPQTVSAQGGPEFTPAPLAAFGLNHPLLNISSGEKFNLEIIKTSNVFSVTSGSRVTYTVTITNYGPDPAQYFYFYDAVPPEFKYITSTFSSNVTALSNNATDPANLQWLVTSPLPVSHSMIVTVTGELTSARDALVVNTAIVTPFVAAADPDTSNNSDSQSVNVSGYSIFFTYYFPLVQKFPTPTPIPILFQDFFNDDGSGWAEGDFGDCTAEYSDSEYRIVVDEDNDCFLPAPKRAEFQYAKVEVSARRSGGNDEFGYGVYMNGQGGGEYYLFRVDANRNVCDWRLIRRNGGNSSTRASGDCDSVFTGFGSQDRNKLAIKHVSNGRVEVYLNDTLLGGFTDGSQLTGVGTGLFAQSDEGDNVTIRFDNFRVYAP